MDIPKKGDPDYVDYVLRMSQRGVLRQGVINEPRAFYDEIVVNPLGTETNGSPGVFSNGEEFPVRLTHMLAAIRYLDTDVDDPAVADPRMIQQIGLRMVFHNEFYMNPTFLPLPIWANKAVAPPVQVDSAISAWDFVANGQPFVLSARDTLQVQVQLRDFAAPANPVPVTVAFTGFGMLSKRPYILNSRIALDDLAPITMDTIDFRNDGTEPIVITDMTVNVGAEEGVEPRGNIDRVSFNVRQVGNGTNGDWFRGPTTPVAINRMQATLAGLTTGRAIVHQFPGDGVIWEPAEGITLAARNLVVLDTPENFNVVLVLAFLGYIMVT